MECFCGCGTKVGFGSRGINKKGRLTDERVQGLEKMHDELVASREAVSASAEDLEDSRLVLDVLDSLISTVSDRESEGEEFGADFEMAVHGVLPPPAEARAIRRDWEVWKKVTERFVNEWESGSLRTDLSRFRRTGEF